MKKKFVIFSYICINLIFKHMENTSELLRIAKYLANNKLPEQEIFNLLEKYQSKLYKFAWERGWRMKSKVSDRAREANTQATKKIEDLDQDRLEDPFPLDINKVIKIGVLIELPNGDLKPVEYLKSGDEILYNEEVKVVKELRRVVYKWRVKEVPHLCLLKDKTIINTETKEKLQIRENGGYTKGYWFGRKFVKPEDVDEHIIPYEGKQNIEYLIVLQ